MNTKSVLAIICVAVSAAAHPQGKSVLDFYGPWSKPETERFSQTFKLISQFRDPRSRANATKQLASVDTPTLVRSIFFAPINDWDNKLSYADTRRALFDPRMRDFVNMMASGAPKRDREMAYQLLDPSWPRAKEALSNLVDRARLNDAEAIRKLCEYRSEAVQCLPPLRDMLLDPNCPVDVSTALYSIGRESLPSLLEGLRVSNPDIRRRAVAPALALIAEGGPMFERDHVEVVAAILADPELDKSVSGVLMPANFNNPRQSAIYMLASFGDDNRALESLSRTVGDTSMWISVAAVQAIGGLGAAAQPVNESLLRGLSDPRGEVRTACADALVRLGPIASPLIPRIAALLSVHPWDMRFTAAYMLSHFGDDGIPALSVLLDGMQDGRGDVRVLSGQALLRMAGAARQAISYERLRALVNDPRSEMRVGAALVLSHWGDSGLIALPELVKELSDPAQKIGESAADSIARLSPGSRICAGELRDLLKSPSKETQLSAAAAFSCVAGDGATAVPILIEGLSRNPNGRYRDPERLKQILAALQYLGPIAKDALPAVRALPRGILRDSDYVREGVIRALGG